MKKQLTARAYRRKVAKIQIELKKYIDQFYAICYFDEKTLDWNNLSEMEFQELYKKWKKYCLNKGFDKTIMEAFKWDCLLLKVDLIMQCKYKKEAEAQDLLKLLKKGMQPIEVADYAVKNLNTKAL